ncbi:hypothetical protein DSCA_38950 [Desulfosarcina alkanivorans]|uniref:Uncharacterized protein n=1 Tax=Desulfosarcina alkanivorans TaxID=571177 RepID=A0A5K7YNK4_9BACT|nr:hypothetical protein [Desulfosarcina alkanivorans]BBO69965.1 hypothetical protein DSCA_38950 [Desulfosarcina alkanivorans]
MNEPALDPTMEDAGRQPQNGLVRNRLQSFGLTMVVMGASFFLYYLGCFGTVDGPLTPAKMGAALAGLGVTRRHVILLLLSILIGAISWNWVFNLTSILIGNRMTCKAKGKGARGICGAPVKRIRQVSTRSGRPVVKYTCSHGHRRPDALFHPVKKGAVSHTVCLACLVFVLIAAFGA